MQLYSLLVALVLGAIVVGDGLYETARVDRAWPQRPDIIQPDKGGINRKFFWGPAQGLFELALLVAAWLTWPTAASRIWVIVAVAIHFATRAWSFAYFIPAAIRFEAGTADSADGAKIKRWVSLSPWRVLLEAVAISALAMLLFVWWPSAFSARVIHHFLRTVSSKPHMQPDARMKTVGVAHPS